MEEIIETVTEEKEEQRLEINLRNVLLVAGVAAAKPFTWGGVYAVGIGAGLLFGKKAALKAVGVYVGINTVYNVASFVTGEWYKEED